MNPFPHDIFTEPSDLDSDTLANLGPLTRLAGRWEATKGIDINPKAAAPERRTFIERISFDPIDPRTNGPQLFYGLRYHIHITTKEEEITFHEQVGYWLWTEVERSGTGGPPWRCRCLGGRRAIAETAVRPDGIVVALPGLDQHPGLGEAVEENSPFSSSSRSEPLKLSL